MVAINFISEQRRASRMRLEGLMWSLCAFGILMVCLWLVMRWDYLDAIAADQAAADDACRMQSAIAARSSKALQQVRHTVATRVTHARGSIFVCDSIGGQS